jgi:hypothetical protein
MTPTLPGPSHSHRRRISIFTWSTSSSQLTRVLNDLAPTLVVIGNHHHSKPLSFLTSTVATHLLAATRCPMAAIPIPKESFQSVDIDGS